MACYRLRTSISGLNMVNRAKIFRTGEHDMMRKVEFLFKKRTFSRVCVVFDIFSLVSPRGIEVTEWGWKMYPPL